MGSHRWDINVTHCLIILIKYCVFIRFSHIPFYKTVGTRLVSISEQEIVIRKFYRAVLVKNQD